MEPESPSPYPQVPTTCPYPKPTPSSPHDLLHLWVILNTCFFLRRGVVSTSSNAQARGLPLVGSPWLLIQFIHSYPPYWRLFLHPQPEDAPCRGDRDPHSQQLYHLIANSSFIVYFNTILHLLNIVFNFYLISNQIITLYTTIPQ
jgi:hypothetical protein